MTLMLVILCVSCIKMYCLADILHGSCGAEGDNLEWMLNEEGVLIISGSGKMCDYEGSSPWKEKDVKKAIIMEGVETIGDFAFYHCTSLHEISLPSTLISIGEWAFFYCTNLESVEFDSSRQSSIVKLGFNSFRWCLKLKKLELPESVEDIGQLAFGNCDSLSEFTVPPSVTVIEKDLFSNCSNLQSISFYSGIKEIKENAFSGCNSLSEIHYYGTENSWKRIKIDKGNSIISSSPKNYLTIQDNIKVGTCGENISWSFYCGDLIIEGEGIITEFKAANSEQIDFADEVISIDVRGNITRIGANAFSIFKNLENVSMNNYVQEIGENVFGNCSNLRLITFDGSKEEWDTIIIDKGNTFGSNTLFRYLQNSPVEETVSEDILNAVQQLRKGMTNRDTTIVIQIDNKEGLDIVPVEMDIYKRALEETPNEDEGDYLKYHILDFGVMPKQSDDIYTLTYTISYRTTYSEEEYVKNEIKRVVNNLNLTEHTSDFTIIKTIYEYVCNHVSYDYWTESNNQSYAFTAYGALSQGKAVCQGYSLLLYRMLKHMGIDSRLIVGHANGNIETLHMWNIAAIDGNYYYLDSTFDSTSEIEGENRKNYFLKGVESFNEDHQISSDLSNYDYWAQYPMAESDFEPAIDTIYYSTYENVIYEISENSAKVIGYTHRPKHIVIRDNVDGTNVTAISGTAFENCDSLVSVEIPASVYEIEDGYWYCENAHGAFYNCIKLKSIIIPEDSKLETIGENAFWKCYNLEIFKLPSSIKKIGPLAFMSCHSIKDLNLPDGLVYVGEGALNDTAIERLYIPASCNYFHSSNTNPNLEWIEVDERNNTFISIDGLLIHKANYELLICPPAIHDELIIPDYVKYVYGEHFNNDYYYYDKVVIHKNTTVYSMASIKCNEFVFDEDDNRFMYYEGALYSQDGSILFCVLDSAYREVFNIRYGTVLIGGTAYGGSAFKNANCKKVVVPDTVTEIGVEAFRGCPMEEIDLPNSIRAIKSSAFFDCRNLKELMLPDSVTEITGQWVFAHCESLERIQLPNRICCIPDMAFQGDSKLQHIIIPETVETIGFQAFVGAGLTEIQLPSGLKELGYNSLAGTQITEIEFPNSLKSLPGGVCSGCESLLKVIIPPSIEEINDDKNRNFTDHIIVYGENGSYAEQYAVNKNYPFFPWNTDPAIIQGNVNNITWVLNKETGHMTILGTGSLTHEIWESYGKYAFLVKELVIDEGITKIEIGPEFIGLENLESLSLPASLEAFEDVAYISDKAKALKTIDIASDNKYYKSYDNVVYSKDGTCLIYYPSAREKTDFIVPEFVDTINGCAFCACNSLSSIIIKDNVKHIGGTVFSGCYNLTEVVLECPIEAIPVSMFYACHSLKHIKLCETVKRIEPYAFCGCDSLQNINFIDNVQDIEKCAFSGCYSLYDVVVPPSVKYIGDEAFSRCKQLNSFTASCNLKDIEKDPFKDCYNLRYVNFEGDAFDISGIEWWYNDDIIVHYFELSSGWEEIISTSTLPQSNWHEVKVDHVVSPDYNECGYAIGTCCDICEHSINFEKKISPLSDMEILMLPSHVSIIEAEAFAGGAFSALIIPDDCRRIESRAFSDCSSLTYVSIPSSVEYMASDAFTGCKKIVFDRR